MAVGPTYKLFAAGVLLGLACSDRTVEVDEEAERLCTAFCKRYPECDLPPESDSVEDCVDVCTSYEWTWGDDCREEYIAAYECINAATCEQFAINERIIGGELTCEAETSASSSCTQDHGGIHPGN